MNAFNRIATTALALFLDMAATAMIASAVYDYRERKKAKEQES